MAPSSPVRQAPDPERQPPEPQDLLGKRKNLRLNRKGCRRNLTDRPKPEICPSKPERHDPKPAGDAPLPARPHPKPQWTAYPAGRVVIERGVLPLPVNAQPKLDNPARSCDTEARERNKSQEKKTRLGASQLRMELPAFIVLGIAVALILFSARPGARRSRRSSGRPRLWDSTPGTGSASWFGLSGGGDSGAFHPGLGHSHYDSGYHSSTNAPSDGGGFDGGGGGDGGGGDG